MNARPAEFYLIPGSDSVVITGRICALLGRHAGLDDFRIHKGGIDPELDAQLLAMHMASLRWKDRDAGTQHPEHPEPQRELNQKAWLSPAEAGSRLDPPMTDRGVRKAVLSGRLPATEMPNGHKHIDPEDLEQFQASRGR